MQLYLIATPDQQRSQGRLRCQYANMAYRMGAGSMLLRQNMAIKRQEGVLALSDREAPVVEDVSALCQGMVREWGRQNYQGVLLDFEQAPTPDRQAFVEALDAVARQYKKKLYVPIAYAPYARHGIVLVDTAVSGGNFKQYLEESKEHFGAIALDLQRLRMDFLLPAPNGMGTPIDVATFTTLQQTYQPTAFFSQELCTHYFTYQTQGETHFVLFDDGHTMEQKIHVGESLGIEAGFFVYHEVEDLIPALLGKKR